MSASEAIISSLSFPVATLLVTALVHHGRSQRDSDHAWSCWCCMSCNTAYNDGLRNVLDVIVDAAIFCVWTCPTLQCGLGFFAGNEPVWRTVIGTSFCRFLFVSSVVRYRKDETGTDSSASLILTQKPPQYTSAIHTFIVLSYSAALLPLYETRRLIKMLYVWRSIVDARITVYQRLACLVSCNGRWKCHLSRTRSTQRDQRSTT